MVSALLTAFYLLPIVAAAFFLALAFGWCIATKNESFAKVFPRLAPWVR